MKRNSSRLTMIRAAIALAASTLIFPTFARRVSEEDYPGNMGRCKNVQAKAISMIVTQGCQSNFLCFTGNLVGSEILKGTSKATIFGLSPSVGLPGIEAATTMSFSGERVISTKKGSLTLHVVGVFDTAADAGGQFGEIEKVTGGTGRFAGATGFLRLVGDATNAELTSFEGEFSGTICLAHDD